MKNNRRSFLRNGIIAAAGLSLGARAKAKEKAEAGAVQSGKKFGTIFNNDINNILASSSGPNITPEEYQRAVYAILDLKPGLLAQNVGMPDPVIYRSSVATSWAKYHDEVWLMVLKMLKEENLVTPADLKREGSAMNKLLALGTDPLTLTIEACRKRNIPIVASYRMNAEDFYQYTTLMYDFGRAHPQWKIPGANCLDPALPGVYKHRMAIFHEVADRYDVDGIEFDFRRWYHMISNPLVNYPVLTRMVRETRQMLDEAALKKGQKRMILGVRVGPSLGTNPNPFVYPGSDYPRNPEDASCKELGLDVKSWIKEGLVDYVCPSLFGAELPGLPKTKEFALLAENSPVGIYPALWYRSAWMLTLCKHSTSLDKKDQKALALYKDDLCTAALRMYEDGADGISTYNWDTHRFNAGMMRGGGEDSAGAYAVQTCLYPRLGSRAAIRRYRDDEPWVTPPGARSERA